MILAIDTATRWLGLALYDGTAGTVLAEVGWRSQNTQTQELAPAVQGLLGRGGVSVAALEAIALTIGPGSYTGLRIGLGVAKGLALAQKTPLVGVPTLDVVANSVDRGAVRGQLLAVIEAGRRRISVVPYAWERRAWVAQADPENTTWEELLEGLSQSVTIAGEVSVAAGKLIRGTKRCRLISAAKRVRRPAVLAELAWAQVKQGVVDSPETLTPRYFRSPG